MRIAILGGASQIAKDLVLLLAARDRLPKWATALVCYSIASTAYGIWIWVRYVLPVR